VTPSLRSIARPFAAGFLLVLAVASPVSDALAQDSQYWTLQYGTRGELLGGVVVGSAVDLSATFYNPGSLALVKDPSVILTATVIGSQKIEITDANPDQEAIATRRIGPEPSMLAGLLPLKWFGGRMAYSFLTRQQLDARLKEREGLIIGLDIPGDTLSVGGEAILDVNTSEYWSGVTWSKRVRDNIGIGMTLYGVYRSQTDSARQTVEAIGGEGYGAILVHWDDFDYQTMRALAKFGIEADWAGGSFGLALTTPGVPVYGNANILMNRSVIGDTDLDGISDSEAVISHGEDLGAEFRSPLSLAIGGSYRWTSTTLHATAEFFASIDEYQVMYAPAPQDAPGVTTLPAEFVHAAEDVFNIGFGVEHRFSEKTTAYVSFITDRSAYRETEGLNIATSTWDIWHINGGVGFTLGGTDLTLGGGIAWGSNPIQGTTDSEGDLPATVEASQIKYSRVKAILGFAL
jgi:hypothetical protein